jgi:hypothetical protein
MMRQAISILLLILGLVGFALAQQQSPIEQALSQKIMQEINNGLACNTDLIKVKEELLKAKEELAQLKQEGAKPPPKTQ